MNDFYLEELVLALKEMPKNTLWAVGNMEDGPFARLVLPNSNGGYTDGYVACEPGEAHTVPQAIRRALAKHE